MGLGNLPPDQALVPPTDWRYPFLDWFDGIVISGEEKVAKPDPVIFRHLLDRYGLDPATTVFIDDSEANVRAAAAGEILELGEISVWE